MTEAIANHPRAQVYPFKPKPPVAFSAASLKGMVFSPVRFVVDRYVAEGLTLFAGKPKLGKSWLVMDICIAVARGGYTLGGLHPCTQGDVLYCALEDNPRRLKSRMDRLIPVGEWPPRLTFWTEMAAIDNGGIEALEAWIEAQAAPRLIVIDVLNKVRGPKGRDESPYEYDYRSMGPLKALADRYDVALIVIHHTRKMAADDALEAVSGTNGLTGAADSILVLNRTADGVVLYGRGRDIEEFETALEFQKDTCRWSVLGDASQVRISDERKNILKALAELAEPVGPSEVAVVTGQTAGAVRKTLWMMARDGEVQKVGRGKYAHPDIELRNFGNLVTSGGGAG